MYELLEKREMYCPYPAGTLMATYQSYHQSTPEYTRFSMLSRHDVRGADGTRGQDAKKCFGLLERLRMLDWKTLRSISSDRLP